MTELLPWKRILWQQSGAAIDMLANAIRECPEPVWSNRTLKPEYWYTAYHTLFFLDYYLSGSPVGFAPPTPFNLDELDPAGILPERVYTQQELLTYLDHGRKKCRRVIEELQEESAHAPCGFEWLDLSNAELLLSSMRHVQHHAAQLNMHLRQHTDSAPRWVRKASW